MGVEGEEEQWYGFLFLIRPQQQQTLKQLWYWAICYYSIWRRTLIVVKIEDDTIDFKTHFDK